MAQQLDPREAALRATLAGNIDRILRGLGRTPYWLSKQMGTYPASVDKILKQENTASVWFLVRAAEALCVTTDELVATEDELLVSAGKNSAEIH